MATPNEKLAESLDVLKALQEGGRRVFRSDELSRVHRERLMANGFLQEVMRGWLISSSPSAREGDSTPWYASFWEFCAHYCNDRFGDEWHLSPEQSLFLPCGEHGHPDSGGCLQPEGHEQHGQASVRHVDLRPEDRRRCRRRRSVREGGLRLFSPAAALVRVPESFFLRNPIETQVVLASIVDASDVLRLLLNGGRSAKAGYLAAAFRRIGRAEIADEIVKTMKGAGYDVRESDPFAPGQTFGALRPATAPIVGRLQAMWESMRGA